MYKKNVPPGCESFFFLKNWVSCWSGKALIVRGSVSPSHGPREIRPGAFRWTKHDANCEARATLLRRAVLDLLIECIAITGRGTARTAKHERHCLGQRKEQLLDQAQLLFNEHHDTSRKNWILIILYEPIHLKDQYLQWLTFFLKIIRWKNPDRLLTSTAKPTYNYKTNSQRYHIKTLISKQQSYWMYSS